MKKLIFLCVIVLLPALAAAQDLSLYNAGLSAFNAGDYDTAVAKFFELSESSTDADLRAKSEYYLAQSFAKKGLPVSAFIYYSTIVNAGKAHPSYLKAVEGLVNVQKDLNDEFLIPNTLNKKYNDDWAMLPEEVLARINYLIGDISNRSAKFEEATDFLKSIKRESAMFARAQVLLGVVYNDPRYPGGAKPEEAIKAFQTVLDLSGAQYEELQNAQWLATLGMGRVYYGIGQYQKAVDSYERIPRFSKYWDQALFENGFARFQNDDFGGALGSLQALHAPQFAGAFQPESWILKSTTYYFSCLYPEAKTALGSFDGIYLPMAEKLKPLVEDTGKDLNVYFRLINERSEAIPTPVLNWARANERMLNVFSMLAQIEKEKAALTENSAWQGTKIGSEMVTYLDQNKASLTRIAGLLSKNRLLEAYRNIKSFADNAEIIRFETSKAEKELAEAGIDQKQLLRGQPLYRPKMPAEDWNYWKFQGEFWRDEIGYYQYTLKKGCPKSAGE